MRSLRKYERNGDLLWIDVLVTPAGKFRWWPVLGCIDYIPKGQRRVAASRAIRNARESTSQATREAALWLVSGVGNV